MSKLHTEDYGLTVQKLDDKYSFHGDGEHPYYTLKYWRDVVVDQNTIIGYWPWVRYALEIEEEEGHIRCF